MLDRIVQSHEKKEASVVDWQTFHGMFVMWRWGLVNLIKIATKYHHRKSSDETSTNKMYSR
ncbi:MAG: hypothetical protein CBE00_04995 [Planctomycetaceae bacterium TMED240]|nr:hypothetical protein [Rhodopirellula sp.]OUX07401.1 MAG: hypothetical protein CBE00_04995 [Planctomycetaceae bacterium TMED240]